VAQAKPFEVTVIDVLANDSDVDGEINAAMLSILEQPNHGTVSIVGGKVEYKANEAGLADSFRYQICDHTDTDAEATSVADATTQGRATEIQVGGGRSEDRTQPDAPQITLLVNPLGGSVTVSGGGSILYQPDSEFVGTDSFAVEVCRGEECETIEYAIEVAADADRDGLSDASELGPDAANPLPFVNQ